MRVDEFGELREDFHHLVCTLTAGGHHDNVGVSLLCDCMLENGLSAAERPRDEACAALSDRIQGVDYTDTGLHDALRTGFFAVILNRNLDGPLLRHRHRDFFAFIIDEDCDYRVDIVLSGFLDTLYGEFSLEGEGHHDFVGQPAFLDLGKPVGGNYLVSGFCDGSEVPKLLMVQGVCIFTSLEEHFLHGCKVVLKAVIDAGEKARAKCGLEHPALEFHGISAAEASGALEHLHGGVLAVYLYNFGHHFHALKVDVADFVFCHRTVNLYGDKVGNDTGYCSFSFHIFTLYNLHL